jgi:DNA-binding LytR/AlgR family response regulator
MWLFIYIISYHEENVNDLLNEESGVTESETKAALQMPLNSEQIKSVSIKSGKRLHIISISDIVCIQAYGDYVNIMTLQGIYLKEQTLKYFNENLPDEQFLKVHRSYIVNINAIETIERYGRDQYLLVLKNKEKIKATVEGYRRLKEKLSL